MENKEFVLPEKWCIRRTKENHLALNRWFNEKYPSKRPFSGYKVSRQTGSCMHYPKANGYFIFFNSPYRGYTVITYEQFLQYVVGNSQTYSIY